MVAKPKKTKGKLPVSRHPLFAPMIGLWFAALFGLGSLAIRPALLESAVLALRLDLVVPAAAPPLGFTFRILLALALFVIGGLTGFLLARRMARPAAPQGEGFRFSRVRAKAETPAPAPVADDYEDDDDFARLDSARLIQEEAAAAGAAAAPALPGRRRALAMEEDFGLEFHELAPVPGHKPQTLEPQILDLSELGSFEEEAPFADHAADPTVENETDDGEPQFDPWHRHPAAPARPVQEFIPDETKEEAEDAPVADFSRPSAPAQDFAARSFDAPHAPDAIVSDNEPARAFDAPPAFAASFDAADHAVEAVVHPVAEHHDAANDEEAETQGEVSATPAFDPVDPAAFAEPADLPASTGAVQPAGNNDAEPSRPLFGTVSGDAAERLVAMPLTSLGVVQLAERLALAIARKREQAEAEQALAPALPADLAPPQPPVPVAFPVPPSLTAPAPEDFVPPAPLQIFPGYEAELDEDIDAEDEAGDSAEAAVTPLFNAPSVLPAALRPISFDEPADDDQLPSILPPRTFPKLAEPTPTPVSAPDEAAEEESYASLLDMSTQSRSFVRVEEPEQDSAEVEPVVIFPGQENRAFAAPVEAAVANRLFDTPPVPAAPLRMPVAATRAVDAEETERQLKAALATLQRMSGAA